MSRVVFDRFLAPARTAAGRGLWMARTAVVALVAGSAVAGGVALTGIEASIVTAPPSSESVPERTLLLLSTPEPIWPDSAELRYLTASPEPRDPGPDLSFVDEGRRLTRDEVKLLAQVVGFPEHTLEEVADVAWCESRFDPRATNDGVRGLMQLHVMWFGYAGVSLDQWADPLVNMEVALVVYYYDLGKGYEPWTQWQCRPGGRIAPPRQVDDEPDAIDTATPTPETSGDDPASQSGITSAANTPAAGSSDDVPQTPAAGGDPDQPKDVPEEPGPEAEGDADPGTTPTPFADDPPPEPTPSTTE